MTNSRKIMAALFAVGCLSATAEAQQLTEGFDTVVTPAVPTGWTSRNQSTTIGTNPTCWGTTDGSVFAPQAGAQQGFANFNCTTATNTISGWLLTPQLTNLRNGQVITFFTRSASDSFPDRMQVRLCTGATGTCTAAGSTGTTSTDVGLYTTLLLDINPTLVGGVYPITYATQQSITLAGLPAGANIGAIAFRYFVTSGGPTGANSNFIGLDTVNVTPVELMEFSVD